MDTTSHVAEISAMVARLQTSSEAGPGVWPCRRWVGYGKSLKRGGSPDPKKKPKPSEITREFLGERIDSKKDPHVFFFSELWMFQKSHPLVFFSEIWTFFFFFWDVSNPVVLGSASGAVAPIFPWLSMGRWTCQ